MVKKNYNRMDAIGSNPIMYIKNVRCVLIFGEHGKAHVVSHNIPSIILWMNNVGILQANYTYASCDKLNKK